MSTEQEKFGKYMAYRFPSTYPAEKSVAWSAWQAALSAAPTPGIPEKAMQAIIEAVGLLGALPTSDGMGEVEFQVGLAQQKLDLVMREFSAAPTPPEVEPFLFIKGDGDGGMVIRFNSSFLLDEEIPLYTHPAPPSELVKAAEEVCKRLHESNKEWELFCLLRSALDKVKS